MTNQALYGLHKVLQELMSVKGSQKFCYAVSKNEKNITKHQGRLFGEFQKAQTPIKREAQDAYIKEHNELIKKHREGKGENDPAGAGPVSPSS